jgi:hypothetical protein
MNSRKHESTQAGEILIPDSRAALTPSDIVERKLAKLLHGEVPVSQRQHSVPRMHCATSEPLAPPGRG